MDTTTGDSVPIMVRYAVDTDPFTFITLNKNTLEPTERICEGTTIASGYTILSLVNNFLFLKKGGQYFVCHYDTEAAGNLTPL